MSMVSPPEEPVVVLLVAVLLAVVFPSTGRLNASQGALCALLLREVDLSV